jgi:hypothetical protein
MIYAGLEFIPCVMLGGVCSSILVYLIVFIRRILL